MQYDRARQLSSDQRPRQNPQFEPRGAFDMYVEHVWQLCDGLTTVDHILELSKLDLARTMSILGALRISGALLLPGEAPGDVEVCDWPTPDPVTEEPDPGASGADLARQRADAGPPPARFARGSAPPPVLFDDSRRLESLFDQACVYETKGNFDDALRLFAAVVRDAPSAENLRRAAQCALSAWDLDQAERWILDSVEIDSQDAMSLRVLADVYLAQDRYERAEVVLRRAIEVANPHGQLAAAMRIDLDHVRRLLARAR